jgi:PAS domain S-box-containing protein
MIFYKKKMTKSILNIDKKETQETGSKESNRFNNERNYFSGSKYLETIKNLNLHDAELHSHLHLFDFSTLLSISDLQGNIVFVNKKFCEISKYSEEELIGMPHNIVRHPLVPSSFFSELWETIGNGGVWNGEIKNSAKDGTPYWVIATIAPVLGNNGKPIKYISMQVDITRQKKIEEELRYAKRKIDQEMYDNVNYAKHIHNSFLTPEDELKAVFPESFLIYKAQKIISGDFYRVEQYDNKSLVVLGDSTGHGFSASYISIMVLNILTRIVKPGHGNPSKILHTIHKEINQITHLNKKNPFIESADTIVCSIDQESLKMNYASAKMRGIVISNGEIKELEKDRCSIGELSEMEFCLTDHNIQLIGGDCIYLFSDGIIDQFGGARDKKFSYSQLLSILKENHCQTMVQQKKNISDVLSSWQGNNEQTDDMTILGLRI